MPEWWFRAYLVHAGRKLLPHRREQLQLAAIATELRATRGGEADMQDFMFETLDGSAQNADGVDNDVAAMRSAMAFNPRKKKES